MLRTLINSLVETVGLVQNDVARIHHWFVNNWINCRAERHCQGCSLQLTSTSGLVGEGGVERVLDAFRS